MPATATFLEMQNRTRQWADAELGGSAANVGATELKYRVNSATKQLYSKMVIARGAEYYLRQETFTMVDGQSDYDITNTDFWQLVDLRLDDGTRHRSLQKWMPTEKAALLSDTNNGAGNNLTKIFYRLRARQISGQDHPGSIISLVPAPRNTTWTLTLDYVPAFIDMIVDADTFDGVNGWEDWAVLTAAMGILSKQESDTSALMGMRATLDQQIDSLAAERDAARPEHIQDVLGDWAGQDTSLESEWDGWGW